MFGMGLQHRGEGGLRLVRQPVGGLLGDDLDLRVGLDAVLEAVEPLDRRRRARQAFEHRDLAALGQKLVGDILAGLLGDLEIVAADEGRVVLAGIADGLAVELDDRNAGLHRAGDDGGQRRGLERRDQDEIDLLGDEIVHLRGLGVHIAGAVGDLQRELRDLLGRRGQFVIDVLAVGLGVVGLREADHVLVVLAAGLGESAAEAAFAANASASAALVPNNSRCMSSSSFLLQRRRAALTRRPHVVSRFIDPVPRGDGRETEEPRRAR